MAIYESRQRASGVYGRVVSLVDRVVSPETRSELYTNISGFSHEQPLLAVSTNQLCPVLLARWMDSRQDEGRMNSS
jgi:hypothetical protein